MTIDTKENDTFVCKRLMSDDRGNNFVFRLISLFWGSLLCKDYATCKKKHGDGKKNSFHSEPQVRHYHRVFTLGANFRNSVRRRRRGRGCARPSRLRV